jgi:hypothetical protein
MENPNPVGSSVEKCGGEVEKERNQLSAKVLKRLDRRRRTGMKQVGGEKVRRKEGRRRRRMRER